ncbi:MAG TPA: HNH endonuclease signature motif containing protein, partial [Acidimicrobiia bacterium]|nr:HNH endonuclease signature motif containing protein [Acidimicrobiia bacterium]
LVDHGTGSSRRGVVDLRVDLATLAELTDAPGDLGGYGPVIADVARQVAAHQEGSRWRVAVTDPDSGAVMWNGTTRRRPSAAQRRYVEARSPSCVFPGCRMPATRSDLDHRVDHSKGGPTLVKYLNPLCRHDHRLKDVGWKVRPGPDGTTTWTSPLGHTYTTGPDPP